MRVLGGLRSLDGPRGLAVRVRPARWVRLLVSRLAAMTVLTPKLGHFAKDYREVVLDVTTTEERAGQQRLTLSSEPMRVSIAVAIVVPTARFPSWAAW